MAFLKQLKMIEKGPVPLLPESHHSTAIAILKKSEAIVKNTTAASKYIPRRPRISIN